MADLADMAPSQKLGRFDLFASLRRLVGRERAYLRPVAFRLCDEQTETHSAGAEAVNGGNQRQREIKLSEDADNLAGGADFRRS